MRPLQRRISLAVLLLGSSIVLFVYPYMLHAEEGAADADPVLLSAGDIATCDSTRDSATADLLDTLEGTIATLGDTVYPDGTHAQFAECYDPTWGRHKARARPAPGNHDYHTSGAEGYYTYFGAAASPLDSGCTKDCKGYYSYDLGAWHIIALNSENDMSRNSEQVKWLFEDLAAHPTLCTLAYWHHPRFSSGQHGNDTDTQALWDVLYEYGVEVVLNGHDHNYERFAPQDPTGKADANRGIREFVVGTGGIGLRSMATTKPNSEVRNSSTWGVLKLTLHATSYDWQFVPIAGQTFTDTGSTNCFSVNPATPQPTPTDSPTPTGSPTPVPTLEPGEHTFPVEVDTHAQSDKPTTNFGNVAVLRVDASPERIGFLRFNVPPLQGTVVNATLQVYARSSSRRGYEVRSVSNDSWGERILTFLNMPGYGDVVGASGAFSKGEWTEVDVTSLVDGGGIVSLALTGISSTSITLSSQESDNPPKLVVTNAVNEQTGTDADADLGNKPELLPVPDSDGDGLSDEDEEDNKSNLNLPDSDGDKLPDLWEVEGVLDPTSSSGQDGPQGNPDADELSNLVELEGHTDPLITEGSTTEVIPGEMYIPFVSGE